MFKGIKDIFGKKKEAGEQEIPSEESMKGTRRRRRTGYYSLYKRTRCRFLPQLCNANYQQTMRAFEEYQLLLFKQNPTTYDKLMRVFPIPLVFIAPRKKALAYYAIYSGALAEYYGHPSPASYMEFGRTFNIDPIDIRLFVKTRLMLYKTVTPFRIALGVPVYSRSGTKVPNQKIVFGFAEQIFSRFAVPSAVLVEIYNLAKQAGIISAVRFAYTLTHASDRLSKILKTTRNPQDIERIARHIDNKYKELLTAPQTISIAPRPPPRPPQVPPSIPPTKAYQQKEPTITPPPPPMPPPSPSQPFQPPKPETKPQVPSEQEVESKRKEKAFSGVTGILSKVTSSIFSEFGKLAKGIAQPQEEEKSNRYCPNCGVIVPKKAKFCPECGEKLQ